MKKVQFIIAAYESARLELIERIKIRDQVLLLYIGAFATILALALSGSKNIELMLILPFISFGCAVLVSQHNSRIGTLALFCAEEITMHQQENDISLTHWDNSVTLRKANHSVPFRTFSHLAIILLPAIIGIGFNWKHAFYSTFPIGVLWWVAFGFVTLAIWVIYVSHSHRLKVHDQVFNRM